KVDAAREVEAAFEIEPAGEIEAEREIDPAGEVEPEGEIDAVGEAAHVSAAADLIQTDAGPIVRSAQCGVERAVEVEVKGAARSDQTEARALVARHVNSARHATRR